jgi:hypothetical protein
VRGTFRQHGVLRGGPPHCARRRRRPHGPEEPLARAIQHARGRCHHGRSPVVEAFIPDEICYDISNSKKSSYVPATTSINLRRGQEILAGDWYACYESIKKGEPCK